MMSQLTSGNVRDLSVSRSGIIGQSIDGTFKRYDNKIQTRKDL
jgi:hypothetical protein